MTGMEHSNQSPNAYARMQVILHWGIALLIAFQYLLHEGIEEAWDGRLEGTIPNEPFPDPHAIVGLIILALAIWRLVLRLRLGAPALPKEEPAVLQLLAKITHIAFYVLLIAMPVSGALAWVIGLTVPADAHEVASTAMLVLIGLHIAGALVQQFVLKTGIMERMSPKKALRPNASNHAKP